jgi:hypothetical protein
VRRGLFWVVLALGLAPPAHAAAAQFVAPRAAGAHIAADGAGRAFLVSASAGHAAVSARFAAPGARFGPQRTLMRSTRTDRAVDAGVADDGSGVIVVQNARRVRAVAFDTRGRLGVPVTLSRGDRSDYVASAVAPSGAAVVVWFRHQGRRWRLEAAVRDPGSGAFGQAQPVSAFVRRPCCTSVSVAIGERGDVAATWTSTSRPAVWTALRSPGGVFRRPQRLATDAADAPRAVVGAGGTAAVIYSVQHVPLRSSDGLQLHRARAGGAFGPAEHVNPGGGVTPGAAAVTPGGRVVVAWVGGDRVRVAEGEALAAVGELGAAPAPRAPAVAAGEDGRAVVAWSERVPSDGAYREQAVAAMRPAQTAGFGGAIALGSPGRAAQPGAALLLPSAEALVTWQRRSALVVTRLP